MVVGRLRAVGGRVVGAVDRLQDGIERVVDRLGERVTAALAGLLGVGGAVVGQGGDVIGALLSLPGQTMQFLASLPGLLGGAVASLLPGFVLAAIALFVDRPALALVVLILAGIGYTNWMDRGALAKRTIRIVLLGTLGFVGAWFFGGDLVAALGGGA